MPKNYTLLKPSKLSLMLFLILSPFAKGVAQTLSSSVKLTQQEIRLKKELDKFIDAGYTCVIDKELFASVGNVVDAEGVLTDGEEEQIEHAIQNIKENNKIKLLLVTKEDMIKEGSMSDFGVNLGNCLGIGLERVNNGILIQLDVQDRKSFISTGDRSEIVLTDAECSRICRLGNPYFKDDDIKGGVDAILQGLEVAITIPEVKELTQAEKEIIARKMAQRKEILKIILLFMLGTGVLAGGGYWINKRKRQYDQRIEEYNSKVELLDDIILQNTGVRDNLQNEIRKMSGINLAQYSWARNEVSTAIQSARELLGNGGASGESLTGGFKQLQSTWAGFLFVQQLTQQMIKNLDATLETSTGVANRYKEQIKNLQELYNQYSEVVGAILNKTIYEREIDERLSWSDTLKNEGFSFSSTSKTLTASAEESRNLFTQLESDAGTIQSKYETLGLFDKQTSALQSIWEKINTLHINYTEHKNQLPDITLTETHVSDYDALLDEIRNLVPESALQDLIVLAGKNKNILAEQKQAVIKYQQAYDSKDLEETDSLYTQVADNYQEVQKNIQLAQNYLDDTQKKKELIPSIIKECEQAHADSKNKLHSKYANDLDDANDLFITLKKNVSAEKYDWIALYDAFKELKTTFEAITTNSKNKFQAEEEAREKAEEAARERAREKAEEEAREKAREKAEEAKSNDNFGGGHFSGGGGGGGW